MISASLRLVLAELRLEVDLDPAVAEDLHGGVGKLVGNQNLGHGICLRWRARRPAGCWKGKGIRRRRSAAKAQSSQGVSASTSAVSTVVPHQIAQARRRVAVAGDVVGHALALEELGHPLDEVPLRRLVEPGHRRIDDPEADRGVRPRRRLGDQVLDPVGPVDPGLQRRGVGVRPRPRGGEPADPLHPLQRVDRVGDAEHRRRVDRLAGEDALDQLAALGQAEDLRQRPRRA